MAGLLLEFGLEQNRHSHNKDNIAQCPDDAYQEQVKGLSGLVDDAEISISQAKLYGLEIRKIEPEHGSKFCVNVKGTKLR